MKARPVIVLDVDQTLVQAVDERSLKSRPSPPDVFVHQIVGYDDTFFHLFHRPYLASFLQWLFSEFRVGFWSMGSREYVNSVLEAILPGHCYPSFVYTHNDCIISQEIYNMPKSLKMLKQNLRHCNMKNLLLIDDLCANSHRQTLNSIVIPAFDVFDPRAVEDHALSDLMKYLNKIKDLPDLRRIHSVFENKCYRVL